ncbi:cation:proton antiporter [Marinitoga sp. 1135]|uniref:Multisubunit Na+/H+ antiporter, MnhF subunit n=1 Tax=Marinitoga piezophila (strain DSM 14283 / JCM 11233 / KA3) TaxID=443254 RepID=H2J5R7_MARPK|nr:MULTISPECIES: cation:proton antiporter [Marinitoga]AEX85053.1 multisubunit Na+/H+ antiporter, MnhF subunit [Marinitoga piezophila KA3]APT75561.1 cation:proton antiporter [Marinitoga sp. 1137]NUU95271.1 cation:proton antiporter [Marinitoga sp. 1135]NUU97205.1 cation:proton antiporter [Marinitoga sp. 1138]
MNTLIGLLIAIGAFFSIIRLIQGPTTPDRVVAIDTLNVIITGSIVFLAFLFKSELYLDIALVYGALSFLETVVIARYLEGKK